MTDPFDGLGTDEWSSKRDELIDDYPLELKEIREVVLRSYDKLLQTRVGDPADDIRIFEDVDVGAQTTGAFLETIIANELEEMYPVWRQGSEAEKDLVHTENPQYSTEIKMSGQINDEVFGNRSFAQESDSDGKKSKSGYYLTLNVHISEDIRPPSHQLFLIRFGWIDFDDWTGQAAATGQAASLTSDIYQYKLKVIEGEYMLNTPLRLVHMIGPSKMENVEGFLKNHGITTVGEFLEAYEETSNPSSALKKIYDRIEGFPSNTITMERDNLDLTDTTTQTTL